MFVIMIRKKLLCFKYYDLEKNITCVYLLNSFVSVHVYGFNYNFFN